MGLLFFACRMVYLPCRWLFQMAFWTIPWAVAIISFVMMLTVALFPDVPNIISFYVVPLLQEQIKSYDRAEDIPLLPERLGRNRSESPSGTSSRPESPIDSDSRSFDSFHRLGAWVTIRRQYGPATKSLFAPRPVQSLAGARQSVPDDLDEPNPIGSLSRAPTGSGSGFDLNGFLARDDQSVDNVSLSSNAATFDDSASFVSNNTFPTAASSNSSIRGTNGSSPAPAQGKTIWQTARQALPWGKPPPPKERYFCVLKGSTIYLYEDDKQADSAHAIAVDRYNIEVHTALGKFAGRDGEMFNKKNAIVLKPIPRCETSDDEYPGMPSMQKPTSSSKKLDLDELEMEPWFLFFKNHSQMEDWYLALVQKSLDQAKADHVFDMDDMKSLIGTLDKEEDPIPTRWLVGFLGRIFFALHKTAFVEQFIKLKIERKLSKVPKQKFVKDVAVREVNLGTFPPIFSKPMLKEASPDGHVSFETHVRYIARDDKPNSAAHLTFAAVIATGFGNSKYDANVVVCAKIKRIEGNMIFQIKPAPSNRIWYGFVGEPTMDFDIIIMTGAVTVQGSFIIESIKNFLRKAMSEAIVAPNLDDLSFFDTQQMDVRGGIFNESSKMAASPKEREEVVIKDGPSQPGVTLNPAVVPSTAAIATTETTKSKGFFGGRRTPSPTKSKSSRKSRTPSPKGAAIGLPGSLRKAQVEEESALHKSATEPVLTSEPMAMVDSSDSGVRVRRKQTIPSINGLPVSDRRTMPDANAPTRPQTIHTDLITGAGVDPGVASANSGSSAPIPIARSSPTERTGSLFSAFARPKSVASTDSKDSKAQSTTRSASPSDTLHQRQSGETARPGEETRPTTQTTIIESIRARDKAALEARAMASKTKMFKWGTESLAKGRAEYARLRQSQAESSRAPAAAAQPVPVPAPLYRPPSEDGGSSASPSSHTALSPAKTFQERLNERARAAAAAADGSGRDRSASNASASSGSARHALLSASPSKADAAISAPTTSEPELVMTTRRSPDKPSASADHDARRPSFNATSPAVQKQPLAGVGMTVPRVPKRAGQVTGLGSSPASAALLSASQQSSRASTAESTPAISHPSTPVEVDPPSLPPRKSEPGHPVTTGFVPPPLPPRKSAETSRPEKRTSRSHTPDLIGQPPANPSPISHDPLGAPERAPTPPQIMALETSLSLPDPKVQTPRRPSTDELLASPPPPLADPSEAQAALRKLTGDDVHVQ